MSFCGKWNNQQLNKWYPVVSIQSRFDTSRFDTNFTRFEQYVVWFKIWEKISTVGEERFTVENMAYTQMFIDLYKLNILVNCL